MIAQQTSLNGTGGRRMALRETLLSWTGNQTARRLAGMWMFRRLNHPHKMLVGLLRLQGQWQTCLREDTVRGNSVKELPVWIPWLEAVRPCIETVREEDRRAQGAIEPGEIDLDMVFGKFQLKSGG